jgi:hypothetical protein
MSVRHSGGLWRRRATMGGLLGIVVVGVVATRR